MRSNGVNPSTFSKTRQLTGKLTVGCGYAQQPRRFRCSEISVKLRRKEKFQCDVNWQPYVSLNHLSRHHFAWADGQRYFILSKVWRNVKKSLFRSLLCHCRIITLKLTQR
ncbi:hypothetical protein KCP74_10225 [Salmonella enterica subsp. enterica]|nr:hypothetical protein KCP74_10225 [Salmonella enterica subsp. enterica]